MGIDLCSGPWLPVDSCSEQEGQRRDCRESDVTGGPADENCGFVGWQTRGYHARMGKMDMRKLASVVFMTLLACTVSMAQPRKTLHKPRHAAATTATQDLLPEAAAMRDAPKFRPGRPLGDDGGDRIRPRSNRWGPKGEVAGPGPRT